MAEFLSLGEAVSKNLSRGNTVCFEGFTHLIPHASAHEVIRQKIGSLTIIRMTPDVIYDQLIGMSLVKKMIFSYAGNPGVGLLRRFRDSVENGWPNKIEIEEHSHSAMAHAYEAGAAGLPCAIFRGYKGAELRKVNPNIKTVTCPFTGEELAAIPSLKLDVAFIHAQKADKKGNVLIEGILGVQKEAVLASKRSVVTVEEIVEDLNSHPNATVLPEWTISSICHVPGGAHPSYVRGYYKRDNASYIEWDKIASDREIFNNWMKENVLDVGSEIFQSRVENLRESSNE